jgi:hypothetical protein
MLYEKNFLRRKKQVQALPSNFVRAKVTKQSEAIKPQQEIKSK